MAKKYFFVQFLGASDLNHWNDKLENFLVFFSIPRSGCDNNVTFESLTRNQINYVNRTYVLCFNEKIMVIMSLLLVITQTSSKCVFVIIAHRVSNFIFILLSITKCLYLKPRSLTSNLNEQS